MQIKVFKAESMKEAMAAMKAELGEDAVILHSRKYKKGGFLGFGGKEIIEITAAIEDVPLAERVRGIYKKPPQPASISEFEDEESNVESEPIQPTLNDELPIERPEIPDEPEQRKSSENEKLAETIRNAQAPPPEEIVQDVDGLPVEDAPLPADETNLIEEPLTPDAPLLKIICRLKMNLCRRKKICLSKRIYLQTRNNYRLTKIICRLMNLCLLMNNL